MVGSLVSTGWKHGRWLDSVLMQRPLGAGDGSAARRARAPTARMLTHRVVDTVSA